MKVRVLILIHQPFKREHEIKLCRSWQGEDWKKHILNRLNRNFRIDMRRTGLKLLELHDDSVPVSESGASQMGQRQRLECQATNMVCPTRPPGNCEPGSTASDTTLETPRPAQSFHKPLVPAAGELRLANTHSWLELTVRSEPAPGSLPTPHARDLRASQRAEEGRKGLNCL